MKNFFIPLYWKFTIGILFVVLLFGSINVYLINKSVFNSLEQELGKRGSFVARHIALQTANLILYEDLTTIQNVINDARQLDNSIVYIFNC